MGSIVPSELVARLAFYEAHLAPWGTNATAIGVTSTSVTNLTTAATDARASYTAHVAARAASKAATAAFREKMRLLHAAPGAGADMIQQIKVKAQTTANPNVYTLAQIPGPTTPTPVPAPGTPSDFTVELLQNGSLLLKWKCANPKSSSGTVYQVGRRIGGPGVPWQLIGGTGKREFADATIPAGSSPVDYQIVAVRSTASGNPAVFTVAFGVGGSGGQVVASVVSAPKLAA